MFNGRSLCAILLATMVVVPVARAQEHRSSWMWTASTNPYGAANIIGDPLTEINTIRDFDLWGFDRIYASMGSWGVTDPQRVADWNARLDDAGVQSQMLLGEYTWIYPGTARNSLLNIIQNQLINYNASRTDSRELIDAVHLDIEPHALSAWSTGTNADRRDLLLLLRDTYADVRNLLDANGQTQVKIYADLPVWYDSSASIGWAAGERDQWFEDIGNSLDGISMMAYERPYMSSIISGVQWEIDNFNGEVRIGLEANSIGAGETFPTFQALLNMADSLDAYYASTPAMGGIDFHPYYSWAAQAEHATHIPEIVGDLNYDGFVDIEDLNIVLGAWNQTVASGSQADPSGDGHVDIVDLNYILAHWNAGAPATAAALVPEPTTLSVLLLAGLGLLARSR